MNKITVEVTSKGEIALKLMRNGGGVGTVLTRNQAKKLQGLLTKVLK